MDISKIKPISPLRRHIIANKEVVQYDYSGNPIRVFPDVRLAAMIIVSRMKTQDVARVIRKCCVGTLRTAYGYQGRYLEDVKKESHD